MAIDQKSMTKSVTSVEPSTATATGAELEIYRQNVASKSTPEEWSVFVATCQAYGLNPLRREIYLVSRWTKDGGPQGKGGFKATPQVSIGGLLALADKTKQFRGLSRPTYFDEDGNERKIWISQKGKTPYPYAVSYDIYRAGWEPVTVVTYFHEVCQTNKDGDLTQFWNRMGIHMLEKCGIAKGLRVVFPHLSGLYITDEMIPADEAADHINMTPSLPETTTPAQVVTVEAEPVALPIADIQTIPTVSALKAKADELGKWASWGRLLKEVYPAKSVDEVKKMLNRELTPGECQTIARFLNSVQSD